jgi:phosphoserine phosphatase
MPKSCTLYCYRKNKNKSKTQTKKPNTIALVVFDMDGVLTDTLSSWKYIHQYFGTTNDRSVDDYLRGNIDDMEFIRRDVSLWTENNRLITQDTLNEILSTIPLMKGTQHVFSVLHKYQVKTGIISAGLDLLADRVANELGIEYVFANGIQTDQQGRLTGVGNLMVKLMSKDANVRSLAKTLALPLERCAAVGNSCFDIPMFEACGLGIAFNPEDDCVRKAADVVVEEKDLRLILPVLEPYFS